MSQPVGKPVKLLIDEGVWYGLAAKLRSDGYDVVHFIDVGTRGADDNTVLAQAAKDQRAVLTFNTRDFILLARAWFERKDHSGIIVSDQLSQGELYRRLHNLLQQKQADDLVNTLVYLQDFK